MHRRKKNTGATITFLISYIHGPLFVPAKVVNRRDDALGVPSSSVFLNGLQEALERKSSFESDTAYNCFQVTDEKMILNSVKM